MLDFKGIKTIGQAFADEIFRVFAREHPGVKLMPCNANNEVAKMIHRARTENVQTEAFQSSLFDALKNEA